MEDRNRFRDWNILPKVPQLLSKSLGFDPNLSDSKVYVLIYVLFQCPSK